MRRAFRTGRRDAHLGVLSDLRPFAACSPAELRAIARGSTSVVRGAGTVLVKQGTSVREFLVLASGTALATRDGVPQLLLGAGDWFGDAELLSKRSASSSLIALTDVDAVVMSSREFATLFDAVGPFRRRLVRRLAGRQPGLEAHAAPS